MLQSARDALTHTHVIGPTGVGKSTLLTNLILADIHAGRSVVVIEPKGDLIANVIDRIPPHRHSDVVILDPADDEHPVGWDAFAGSPEIVADSIVHLFRTMHASSWGPRTQEVLHAGLLSLARTPNSTLVELPQLLTNETYRRQVVAGVMDDPALAPFWSWFASLSDAERGQVVAPVLNKARAFTMRTGVRRMLGQSTPSFSIRDVLTKRRILLVPLQPGAIGPETASLLGGLVVAQLWQTVQSRAAIPLQRRHPVQLYLDEFQNYLNLPTEIGDVLAMARGLGLGVTMAHQHLGQLRSPEMRSAVLSNARSRVVFQSPHEDAAILARSLGGGLDASDLMNLDRYEAYAGLMVDGQLFGPGSVVTRPLPPATGTAAAVRTLSRSQFSRPARDVDEQIRTRHSPGSERSSGGRRPRREP